MKRLFSIISFLCIMAATAFADSFDMKIGDQKYIKNSATNVTSQLSCSSSWRSSGSCINIVPSGNYGCYVYALSEGSATITCSWECKVRVVGGSTYTTSGTDYFFVTVKSNKPESVTVSPSSMELEVGQSQSLRATVSPSSAEYSYINWTSSNTSLASISGSGTSATVKALKPTTSPIELRATTDNGKYGRCSLTIYGITPTGLSITQPGTLIAEGDGTQLSATFTPSNHRSSITWSSSNSAIARVSSSGYVTPVGPGKATITAKSGNGLTANATVNVVEPSFTVTTTTPNNYESNIDVLSSCSVTFSLPIHADNTSGIKLTGGGQQLSGQVTVSGNTLMFKPNKAMLPLTRYTLNIPKGSVLNKWNTSYPDYSLTFNTGRLKPMELYCNLESGFVEAGELVMLQASEPDAAIYYTLDGSEPTENSLRFQDYYIVIDHNLTLRAKAFKDGYETPEFKAEYKLTTIRYAKYYPKSSEELYLYKDVNPFVQYTFDVNEGPNFQDCKVTDPEGQRIAGTFLLNGNILAFVPQNPLPLGKKYTVTLPTGAVMVNQDDQSKAMSWSFVSGIFYRDISAGYENYYAIRTDNTLYGWGEMSAKATDNYGYTSKFYPWSAISLSSNVKRVSSGATHCLYTKFDGSLFGRGRQYCGELGNGEVFSVNNTAFKLQDGVDLFTAGAQATAFVKNGQLMGAGRNDFKQIRDASSTYRQYTEKTDATVDNIKILESGYGNFYTVTTDGKLYGWGDNSLGHLLNGTKSVEAKPILMLEDVDTVAASRWTPGHVAVIKHDHTLWTWGNNAHGQLGNGTHDNSIKPVKVMDDVVKVAVGNDCMAAVTSNGELWMWGNNTYGQLGIGNEGIRDDKPTPQKIMDDITDVSLGFLHSVALDVSGSVFHWGNIRTEEASTYYIPSPRLFLEGRSSLPFTDVTIINSDIHMSIGAKAVVCAQPVPLKADYKTWEWTTSDAAIATVDSRGVVTAVAKGSAIVTLMSDDGKKATCQVTVGDASTGISELNSLPPIFDVYDLRGEKVRSQTKTIDGLPKGIYVIDHKKVIVK